MFRNIILTTIMLALSGCSYLYGEQGVIKNRDSDYLTAQSLPPLQIPPGLSSSTIQAHYPIADRNYTHSQRKIDLTPPELQQPALATVRTQQSTAQPATKATTVASTTTTHKQRYLTDVFTHPEYIAQSVTPNQKTVAAPQAANSATKTQPQQADSTTPAKKKKYIADYF